jgi:hypothetical protein
MTDDLSKYEEMRKEIQAMWSGAHPWAVAIDELVAMVREAREGNHTSSEHEPTWAELTDFWKKRAEAAEAENAKLREALGNIKGMVCGDKSPRWRDDDTTTASRMRIADICDIALWKE